MIHTASLFVLTLFIVNVPKLVEEGQCGTICPTSFIIRLLLVYLSIGSKCSCFLLNTDEWQEEMRFKCLIELALKDAWLSI